MLASQNEEFFMPFGITQFALNVVHSLEEIIKVSIVARTMIYQDVNTIVSNVG